MKKITFVIEKLDKGYILTQDNMRMAVEHIPAVNKAIQSVVDGLTWTATNGVPIKIEIIATEGIEEHEEGQSNLDTAKMLWQTGQKLEACKLLHSHGMTLEGAKKYCETNF